MVSKKVMEYFTPYDDCFKCHGDSEDNIAEFGEGCGCNFSLPDGGIAQEEIDLLNSIQEYCFNMYGDGATLTFSCGYRCQYHNDRLSGSVPNSEHVQGYAGDVIPPDCMTVDELADIAIQCGAGGVGRYHSMGFVHIDSGARRDW